MAFCLTFSESKDCPLKGSENSHVQPKTTALKKVIQVIYTAWVGILFVTFMILALPFVLFPLLISDRLGVISFFFVRCWVYCAFIPSFIFFRTHHKHLVDRKKSYIFVINHTSFLDAPAIPMAIPLQLRALGKKELRQIPIFGIVTRRLAVWVDRSDQESRKRSIEGLVRILNKGISILVAPEGTRNETEAPLLPFYNGPFRLAIETGIPIMPLIIHDAKKLMPKGQLGLRPGTIHNYFLPEIETKGMTENDLPDLKKQVYDLMEKKVIDLNNKV